MAESFTMTDTAWLRKLAAKAPPSDHTELGSTTLLLVPTGKRSPPTLALDAEAGWQTMSLHTNTLIQHFLTDSRRMFAPLPGVEAAAAEAAGFRRPHSKLPVVPHYIIEFYVSFTSGAHRDAIWIAGHYLVDYHFNYPNTICLTFKIGRQKLEADAFITVQQYARLDQRLRYAATVVAISREPTLNLFARALAGMQIVSQRYPLNYADIPRDIITDQPPGNDGFEFTKVWSRLGEAIASLVPEVDMETTQIWLREIWLHGPEEEF